jgi:hypothetical protein
VYKLYLKLAVGEDGNLKRRGKREEERRERNIAPRKILFMAFLQH